MDFSDTIVHDIRPSFYDAHTTSHQYRKGLHLQFPFLLQFQTDRNY